jgi:hypothetical protein
VLPVCWSIDDHEGSNHIWTFNNPGNRGINTPTNENGFAIIDSDDYGEEGIQNCDLVSPIFDFSHLENNRKIVLEFSHYYHHYDPSSATLSYRNNFGDWNDLQTWTDDTGNPENFSIDLTSELAGLSQVQFRWNYMGEYSWYWAIDDVIISAEVVSVPETLTIADTIIHSVEPTCFNALENITVAGNSEVILEDGATATFIAGNSIRFLPGFHAQVGSTVRAMITTDGTFCEQYLQGSPVVANTMDKALPLEPKPEPEKGLNESKSIKVYPNPNNGVFTLQLNNFRENTRVMLFNAIGQKVYEQTLRGDTHRIELPNLQRGLYVVKAINNNKQFDQKMIVK